MDLNQSKWLFHQHLNHLCYFSEIPTAPLTFNAPVVVFVDVVVLVICVSPDNVVVPATCNELDNVEAPVTEEVSDNVVVPLTEKLPLELLLLFDIVTSAFKFNVLITGD